MISPLLHIHHLSVAFGEGNSLKTAVDGISFSVGRGETVAIVGESGSGKSLTAFSVMRLLPPGARASGKILFAGAGEEPVDLMGQTEKSMRQIRGRKISMIFQEPMTALNPLLTCGRQVAEALRLHLGLDAQAARRRCVELFEKVRLPDPGALYDRYPHQLSGGQKQRVMIAMAISCGPALLIADEPTTALDVTVQKTILELLRTLQREENLSLLLITHDLALVADYADRMLVMYRGKLVEEGETKATLTRPAHPYTRALLACRPAGKPKGVRLPVVSDFMRADGTPAMEAAGNRVDVAMPQEVADAPVLLSVEELTVSYKRKSSGFLSPRLPEIRPAVDRVSFTVRKGQTVGLVGESGCGKTTLGKAILRLVRPASGRIFLNGTDLSLLDERALRKVRKDLQVVFQDPYSSLNPRITIGDAIVEPMSVHGLQSGPRARKEKAAWLLEKVNLRSDDFLRYPHQFSGGQRQRICIARALALEPSFIVFDESVSALDVSVQAQVLNLINELRREMGFTALFITHDLSVVRYISDEILVMRAGKIVESGDAEALFRAPAHPYTRELLSAMPGRGLV
jgi:peptide/nickel transport system ATP-binding protein